MKKQWKNPFWETAQKDRLTVRLNIEHDDGSFTTTVARVSKFDDNGNLSADYLEILEQNTLEKIDEFTEERLERHKKQRQAKAKREKESIESKRLQDLYNLKLQAFEIPEIRNSDNRPLKARIRKAKNVVEMQVFCALLVMGELNKNDNGTTE